MKMQSRHILLAAWSCWRSRLPPAAAAPPTTVNPNTAPPTVPGLHRSRAGHGRRAVLPHQPVGEHQGQQPLRWLPQCHRPVADVRAQRRREPGLCGRQRARQPDRSPTSRAWCEGRAAATTAGCPATRPAATSYHLDPQLGRRAPPAAARRSSCRRRRCHDVGRARPSRPIRRAVSRARSGRWCAAEQLLALPCADAGTPQSPFFASADVDEAYAAARSKIDLDNPANSRLVVRLRDESHNCWTTSCAANAERHAGADRRLRQRHSGRRRSIRPW